MDIVPKIRQKIPNSKIFVTLASNRWYYYWRNGKSGVSYEPFMDVQVHSEQIASMAMCAWTPDSLAAYLAGHGQIGYMYINRNRGKIYDYRIDHGLFLWMLPVMKGNLPWTYQFVARDPYDDTDSAGDGPVGDVMYVYPDLHHPSRNLPALKLIGTREGVDDLRYLYTLKEAIRLSGNTVKKQAAQAVFDEFRALISSKIGAPRPACENYIQVIQGFVSPQQLDAKRVEIAGLIKALGQPDIPSPPPSPSPSPPPSLKDLIKNYLGSSFDFDLNNDGIVNGLDFGKVLLLDI